VTTQRPTLLLWLAAIALLEAGALVVIVIVNAVGAMTDKNGNVGLLLGGELIWLLGVGALCLIAWGLSRRSGAARTPFILAQLFALIMAYPLIRHSGLWIALGLVIAAIALVGIAVALSPRAGAEFN
jgi:hypothetical protein